jgi:ribulose-5-phosphate 4-epimerase/fuculose-1-phosphate aldolase
VKAPHDTASIAPVEGAIHFSFALTPAGAADALPNAVFKRLAAWRDVLRRLKLLGRDARRYDGYHYGNLSVRDPASAARFFITASQTSGRRRVSARQIVRVDAWDVRRFALTATGAAAPSSESISHGMLYAADPSIGWVMHVHSSAIWRHAGHLGLPCTAADVAYGSPAMASAVAALLAAHRERPLVFATLGHGDGVFAAGADADATGAALVRTLAHALGLPR